MKKAVIYARYSAGPRQTDQSIEGQISDCKRYAEAHDLNVIDIYADRHISGKSTEGRDEFLRMIDDAKKDYSMRLWYGKLTDSAEIRQILLSTSES